MMRYKRVAVNEVSIEAMSPGQEPGYDFTSIMESQADVDLFIEKLPHPHAEVCRLLVDGYSFAGAMKKLNLNKNQVYAIRDELKRLILSGDPKQFAEFKKRNERNLQVLFSVVGANAEKISLNRFDELYIKPYDGEAQLRAWNTIPLVDEYERIWESSPRSCIMAPREHLKTTSIIKYLIKKIFTRKFPLEINYYHFNSEIANEKFQKLKRLVQMSPMLSANFQLKETVSWNQGKIELADGTVIAPMSYRQGNIGKHPHIIVLDDVIDKSVMYSDELNKKLTDAFYMNIYPQISKADEFKKLIIIGTVQRKDDLYHMLPKDIPVITMGAYTDKEHTKPLAPELFSVAQLQKIEADMTSRHGNKFWLKEYMNQPFEAIGFLIKEEYIRHYKLAPKGLLIFQGWDLSVGRDIEKGDWTVGITIGIDFSGDKIKIYVLDKFRGRINFDQRLKMVVEYANRWKPEAIGIESNAFQYDTVQQLKDKTLFHIFGLKSVVNKVESFQVELAPYFENGQVYLPEGDEELKNELLTLPVGEYDDQADALKFAIKVALQFKQAAPLIGFA